MLYNAIYNIFITKGLIIVNTYDILKVFDVFFGCFWLRLGFFPGMAFFVYLQIRIKSASVATHSLVHFMRKCESKQPLNTAGSPVQWDLV